MRPLILLAALASAAPALAQSQPGAEFDHPVIVVTGASRVSRPADYAEIEVGLRGDGATQVEALRALKTQQDRVRQGVSALEGVRALNVRDHATYVRETYSPECERDRVRERVRPQGECGPTGFVAHVSARMRVWPAERAGQAMSLAAERGAVAVSLAERGLDDPQALRREAVAAAVRDARLQGEAVAQASGVTLGGLERIVDPEGRTSLVRNEFASPEALVVTGSRTMPAVSLNVAPAPVTQEARVTAVFRIGR